MGRFAVRTGLAKIEAIAKRVMADPRLLATEGRGVFDLIEQVFEQAKKDQLEADPTLVKRLGVAKALDHVERIVYSKLYPQLYAFRKDLLDQGLTAAPAKPVAKQATPLDLVMETIKQRLAVAGKALDDVNAKLALLNQDPALRAQYLNAVTLPGGAARPIEPGTNPTIEPQPTAYSTAGVRPPPSERDRGLEGGE